MTEVCACEFSGATDQLTSCPGYDGITVNAVCQYTEYTSSELLFLTENVDSGSIGYVFAWGVAAVLTLYCIGYGVGLIKRLFNFA